MHTEHLRERLEDEKVRLEAEMSAVGRRNPRVPGDWETIPPETNTEADIFDQADVAVNRDTNVAIFTDLETQYDAVLAALARIEKGAYGVCTACGGVIEEARLEADPSATTCIAHK